jgi:diaminopimelate decarboxylase
MSDIQARLNFAAQKFGTPLYVYDIDMVKARFEALTKLFGGHFSVSYAVKANPNVALLEAMSPWLETFDVSSYKEIERVMSFTWDPKKITFSGPAKRADEIHGAVELGIGELVIESIAEAGIANAAARTIGRMQPVLLRINPLSGPKNFGASFSGRASQFGVDEEVMAGAITEIAALEHLNLVGFHIYSGTNSLNPTAIAENFANFIRIFEAASVHARLSPEKLIFGSGFGLPYGVGDQPLDIDAVASAVLPLIEKMKSKPMFAQSRCTLEMGRWLVGPAGWLLTSVVSQKASRGVEYRLFDAGFNNHLAACGMMGTVIRRNWRFHNLTNDQGQEGLYTLVGPLCTSIDILGTGVQLPELRCGDVIAVENSGAYGLTASPTRFISHPEPKEVLMSGHQMLDVSESRLNTWTLNLATERAGAPGFTSSFR